MMHARRASRDDAALRRLSVRTARGPRRRAPSGPRWAPPAAPPAGRTAAGARELVAAVDEVAAHQQVRAHEQHGKHRDERPERYERREPQLQQLAGARREALAGPRFAARAISSTAPSPRLARHRPARTARRGVARLAPAVAAGVVAGALARATAALDRLATFQLLRERGGQTVLGGRVVVPGRRRAPRRRRGSEARCSRPTRFSRGRRTADAMLAAQRAGGAAPARDARTTARAGTVIANAMSLPKRSTPGVVRRGVTPPGSRIETAGGTTRRDFR